MRNSSKVYNVSIFEVLKKRVEEMSISVSDQLVLKIDNHQVELADINDLVANVKTSVINLMRDQLVQNLDVASNTSESRSPPIIPVRGEITDNSHLKFFWGSKPRPLPEDFHFPKSITVKALWYLWWFGEANENLVPFKTLRLYDLPFDSDRQFLSKASTVMKALLDHIPTNTDLNSLSFENSEVIFAETFITFCRWIYPDDAQLKELERLEQGKTSYVTVYDMIRRLRKRKLKDDNTTLPSIDPLDLS